MSEPSEGTISVSGPPPKPDGEPARPVAPPGAATGAAAKASPRAGAAGPSKISGLRTIGPDPLGSGTVSIAGPPAAAQKAGATGAGASAASGSGSAGLGGTLSVAPTGGGGAGGGSGTISVSGPAKATPSRAAAGGGVGESGTISVGPAPRASTGAGGDPDGTLPPRKGASASADADGTLPPRAGSGSTPAGSAAAAARAPAARPGPAGGADGLPMVGQRFGPYELKSELGRGGMGVVFKALHLTLNREVALKLMLAQETTDEQRTRFLREAEASAALQHPYIVAVHDVGVEDGKLFFSMDFVPGTTLKAIIKERFGDYRTLLGVFTKVCEGIGYAHRKGIIHRDLKPQNVMVDADLNPHVMDFGLARLDTGKPDTAEGVTGSAPLGTGADAGSGSVSGIVAQPGKKSKARLTRVGAVMGTPVYMPPEQAGGRIDEVDTRSDIYSLGVILYAMLTEGLPFQAPSMPELILKIESDPPIPPRDKNPDCPWELERIVLKAIEKKREDRYQSAFELRDDIQAWLDGFPVAAAQGGSLYRVGKFVRRNRALVGMAAVGVIAVAGATGLGVRKAGEDRRELARRVDGLVQDARKDLASAEAARAAAVSAGAGGEAVGEAALQRLGSALGGYGEALRKLAAAEQLAPTSAAVTDAKHDAEMGQQVAQTLERDARERKAKADAAAEARRLAAGRAREAAAALASVKPAEAGDDDAIAAMRKTVDEARVTLTSALQVLAGDPAEALARDGVTLAFAKLQALDDASRNFERRAAVLRLKGEAKDALAKAGHAETEAEARKHLKQAIQAVADALRLAPEDIDAQGLRVEAALLLGERALASDDLALAEYAVDEVVDLDRERAGAFLTRVHAKKANEDRYAQAIERAMAARAGGRFRDAASAYTEAVQAVRERKPAQFGVWFCQGAAAFGDGRLDEALRLLGEARSFVDDPFDRAALEEWRGRVTGAIAAEAVAKARAAADALDWPESEKWLARAAAHAPDSPEVRKLQGEVAARKSVPDGMLLVGEGPFTFGPPAAARDGVACPAFFLGRTEVTNREYRAFVEAGGYDRRELWDAEGFARRADMVAQKDGRPGPLGWSNQRPPAGKDDLPVTGISWFEARAYARWKGAGYRLPSEIEWEKAATWDERDRRQSEPLWIARGADGQTVSTWAAVWAAYFQRPEPKPVGAPATRNESGAPLQDASPSGALDMWGNVRELVVAFDEEGAERPGARGGSFAARLEERALPWTPYRPTPTFRAHDVGFRIARDAALAPREGGK